MYAPPRPDPYIPGHVVHVDVPYMVTFRDSISGNLWICKYPVHSARQCAMILVRPGYSQP